VYDKEAVRSEAAKPRSGRQIAGTDYEHAGTCQASAASQPCAAPTLCRWLPPLRTRPPGSGHPMTEACHWWCRPLATVRCICRRGLPPCCGQCLLSLQSGRELSVSPRAAAVLLLGC